MRYTSGSSDILTVIDIFLVTPGCPPVIATFLLLPVPTRRMAFSSEDFPTLGMPTTSILLPVMWSAAVAVSNPGKKKKEKTLMSLIFSLASHVLFNLLSGEGEIGKLGVGGEEKLPFA